MITAVEPDSSEVRAPVPTLMAEVDAPEMCGYGVIDTGATESVGSLAVELKSCFDLEINGSMQYSGVICSFEAKRWPA